MEIVKINKSHNVSDFQTYEQDLRDFLVEDAFDNQQKNISVTYLFYKGNQLTAYLTLLTDRIQLNRQLKKQYQTENIFYRTLPSLKIGRLCVDDRFQRQGIGTVLINYAFSRLIKVNNLVGCRFITLDSKKDSLGFYMKNGFQMIEEKENSPMYIDMDYYIKSSASQK